MFDAIALGESLIDFTQVAADESGYPTMVAHPGGAPVNYLAALSKFGAKTAMIGKVGDDAFGRLLLGTMKDAGICTKGMITDRDFFTTLAFITLDAGGARDFSFARKPGADTKLKFDEVDLSMFDGCKILHFGTLSLTDEPARDATKRTVEYAKSRGMLISCDPNLRKPLWNLPEDAQNQMIWSFSHADIVKISDDEADFLWDLRPDKAANKILREFGAKLVFVTCGADGAYFANRNAFGWVDALKDVDPIDTTGAGDIFGGSAAWKFLSMNTAPEDLNTEQLREITEFASASAGLSTERYGGIPSVPKLSEVMQKYQKQNRNFEPQEAGTR